MGKVQSKYLSAASIGVSVGVIGLWVGEHLPYPSCALPPKKVGRSHQAAVVKAQLELELLIGVVHERGHFKVVMILKGASFVSPGTPDN